MAIARLSGGPLDGQVLPLEPSVDDQLIVPYGEGQIVYQRQGDGAGDGPAEARFVFVEATESIDPDPDTPARTDR